MREKYEKTKYYYDNGIWTTLQVKNAVRKGWITVEEYAVITGEEYGE